MDNIKELIGNLELFLYLLERPYSNYKVKIPEDHGYNDQGFDDIMEMLSNFPLYQRWYIKVVKLKGYDHKVMAHKLLHHLKKKVKKGGEL